MNKSNIFVFLLSLFIPFSIKAQDINEKTLKRLDSLERVIKEQQLLLNSQKDIKSFYEDKVNYILEKAINSSIGASSSLLTVFSAYLTVLLFMIGFVSFNWFTSYMKRYSDLVKTIKLDMQNKFEQLEKRQIENFDVFKSDYAIKMSEMKYSEFILQVTIAMVQSHAQNPILAIRWILSASLIVFEKIKEDDKVFNSLINEKQLNRLFGYLKKYLTELELIQPEYWRNLKQMIEVSTFERIDLSFNNLMTYTFTYNNEQFKNEAIQLMSSYQDTIKKLDINLENFVNQKIREEIKHEFNNKIDDIDKIA